MILEENTPSQEELGVKPKSKKGLEDSRAAQEVEKIQEHKTEEGRDVGKSFTPPTESTPLVIEEPTDSKNSSLDQYRLQALNQIFEAQKTNKFIHIDTLSGSGMSEFIVPHISKSYLAEGLLPTKDELGEIIDEEDIDTIILDELGWNETFSNEPQEYAEKLEELSNHFPSLKFIIAIGRTEQTTNDLDILAKKLQPASIKIGVKAFNNRQAREYLEKKCPNLHDLDEDTVREIWQHMEDRKKEFSNLWHFRWIRKALSKFDWIFPYDHEAGAKYSKKELKKIHGDLLETGVLKK